jgi:hypothetical protein
VLRPYAPRFFEHFALFAPAVQPYIIPHHETFSTTIQPSYSPTKG